MRIPIKYLIIICFLITSLSGCKKNSTPTPDPIIPDTTKPTILITKPNGVDAFVPGNTIIFQATFADNNKLGSYDIAITKVVTGGLILKNVPTPVAWSYTKSATSFTTGVKQQEINLSDITIPLFIGTSPVATGKYNFKVTCIDGSNNSASTTVEININ